MEVDATWYRLGDGPELSAPPMLRYSTGGTSFSDVATMTRVANGWRASAPHDAHGGRFYLQALGTTAEGADDGSPGAIASATWSNDTIFADDFE
jgi:hypothetical protein